MHCVSACVFKTMKSILIIFFFLSFFAQAQKPFAVVELFTSEGCSSCPPADALLSKTKANAEKTSQNIFFLAYHVDYWNKGGWKDPFSKFQFTLLQENYSRILAEKEMYTPQAVVNGVKSFTGSKEEKLNENIKHALSEVPEITFSVEKDLIGNDTLFVKFSISKSDPNYVLRLALTEDDLSSNVMHGENEGKNLHHDSVVRIFYSIDDPQKTGQAKIPLKGNKITGKHKLIAFIQNKQTMKIIAADKIIF